MAVPLMLLAEILASIFAINFGLQLGTGTWAAIGFLGGVATMSTVGVGVAVSKWPTDPHDTVFGFRIGLNGAGSNEGHEPLVGAGGNAPTIRVFDNLGRHIGGKKRSPMCQDGEDSCVSVVKHVKKQPAYALLQGGKDPICLAGATVRYPGGDVYGWVGLWALTCEQPWYYSDIDAKFGNKTLKLLCAWLGGDGDKTGITTGIRIHWPEFANNAGINKTEGLTDKDYCKPNSTALQFYNHNGPHTFDGRTKAEEKTAQNKLKDEKKLADNKQKAEEKEAKAKAKASNGGKAVKRETHIDRRHVQSHSKFHSAELLCQSKTSAGPSLASVTDRKFCHMPEKKLYPFCDDKVVGTCWHRETSSLVTKSLFGLTKRGGPQFGAPIVWGL